MYLERLDVSGIRNLENQKLHFSSSLNYIYGDNGSGKTSLLESIYLLGRGRSFRTSHLGNTINRNLNSCLVAGKILSDEGVPLSLGVSRDTNGSFRFRLNGTPVFSSSQLANELPLLLINSNSFSLLDGGPGNRRRYLDWLVFHVEQNSRGHWRNLIQILKQRNSLLRRGHGKIDGIELAYWDRELVAVAEQVHLLRQRLFNLLRPVVLEYAELLGGVPGIDLDYLPGWDTGTPFQDQLEGIRERELRMCRTLIGPQRADIALSLKGVPASEILSRGQLKIVVSAMYLAQAKLLATTSLRLPIALVDDLPAELDSQHIRSLTQALLSIGAQVFITGVSLDGLLQGLPEAGYGAAQPDIYVFHVKQGVFERQRSELVNDRK